MDRLGSRLRALSLLCTALALWSVAISAHAAPEPVESFSDVATSLVVEVPVEVTLDGEPVRGLELENFELLEAGKAQTLIGLDVIDLRLAEAPMVEAPTQPARVPVASRRHFLLLFDLSFASPASIERARLAADDLIRDDLHSLDLVGVATYSQSRGVQMILGFTPDREQARLALQALGDPQSITVRSDPLRLYIGSAGRDIAADAGANTGGSAGGGRVDIAQDMRELQSMADRAQAAQGRSEVAHLTRSFEDLGAFMKQVDGRKHVLYFSEGFDGELLLGATDQNRQAELSRDAQNNALWLVDSDEHFGSTSVLSGIEEMSKALRRADCTLHSIDIGGLRAAGGRGRGGKDGLFMIANNTGGSFYENFNDLGDAMGKMLHKTSVTYVLSYQPSNIELDGKYRKLNVRLRGLDGKPARKADVVHRPGYFAPQAGLKASGLETQLDIAQRLFDDRAGEIATEVLAVPWPTAAERLKGRAYVSLLVEVDGPSLLAAAPATKETPRRKRSRKARRNAKPSATARDASQLEAEVFVYALTRDDQIADFFAQKIELDLRTSGDSLRRHGFKLFAPLLLEAGDYTLRVLVRNADTGRTGLSVTPVTVPTAEPSRPLLLPPFLPEATDAWLLVRGRRGDLPTDREPAYPFFHDDTTYVPAARAELEAGSVLPVFLVSYGLGEIRGLNSALLDAEGRQVATPRWKLDDTASRRRGSGDAARRLFAAFEVPLVAAGDYTLQLSLTDAEGLTSSDARVGLRLVAADRVARSQILPLGTDVRFDDAPTTTVPDVLARDAEAPGAASEEPREQQAMKEVADDYRAILLRAESLSSMIDEVARLEIRAVGDHAEKRSQRLTRVERGVALELASQNAGALLPILVLHHDLFLHFHGQRRAYLAHHSQQMVETLAADLHDRGEHGDLAASRSLAAGVLASLGGHLQAAGRTASVRLFEQAIALDPDIESARLGLAAYYEKRGGPYATSVEHLKQLVERRPGSRHGRLRLAINLLRTADNPGVMDGSARREDAVVHLQSLLGGPEADWIYSLAAQEMARHHAENQRLDDAIELLQVALERLPEDQKLALQLAYSYERAHRRADAQRLAERVASDPRVGEAARGRYNTWPTRALDNDRRTIQMNARRQLSALRALTPSDGLAAHVLESEPVPETRLESP